MTEKEIKIVIGGLLHDIGKVIYRTGNSKSHSQSGYEFLRDEIKIEDVEILDAVLYHHGAVLSKAPISNDSFAYITYIADNIASAMDRRKNDSSDYGFEKSLPLQPVFNILNGNKQNLYYSPQMITSVINYPTNEKRPFDENFYKMVESKIKDCLKGIEFNEYYINSLLSILEITTGFVPSSTAVGEVADISLFDHVKMTAAINSCIYQYLKEQNVTDFKKILFENTNDFYKEKAFILYSIDLSGIQKFIYTIHSKDALKMLRARSFYLEVIMEHIVDSLLERLNLSRANLIYSGGGHCYIISPNTIATKEQVVIFEQEINDWFLDKYDISLYMASGYVEASAEELKNQPEGSYSELFRKVSVKIGEKKAHRYSAEQIIKLNNRKQESYSRECRICKRLEHVNSDSVCDCCNALLKSSKDILYQPFFVVVKEPEEGAMILPGNQYLVAESESRLRERIKKNTNFIRAYSKNNYYSGVNVATKIWVGDYTQGQSFEEFADSSEGISRIGVLRADVDNLGQTFVTGFSGEINTLSRTASLSRHLSLFFKYYINGIMENGNYGIDGNHRRPRKATIVYSGGDDLFIVGAWNEIIELSIDIRRAFDKYAQNTLSISAGIGIYPSGYPISRIAIEVGELEEKSKSSDGKNAVTIMPSGTFKWEEFENELIGEKVSLLTEFFFKSEDRGKNFLYNLLSLIRGRDNRINFARYVYLLSRMEPDKDASEDEINNYKAFSKKMYEWILNEKDCLQLETAINIYAYLEREGEKE